MSDLTEQGGNQLFRDNMMASFIQIAALVVLVSYCVVIVGPFAGLVIWGVVTAVALYPVFLKLSSLLRGNQKIAATLIVIAGLVLVLVPGWMMIKSSIISVMGFAADIQSGNVAVPPPNESVADWPLVGERLYAAWVSAAQNIEKTLIQFEPQLRELAEWSLRKIGSTLSGMLQIAASTIIAGVAMMYAKSGHGLSSAIAEKIVPGSGEKLTNLSIATIRSVTNGVLGVAVIQAVLLGIGFYFMGVPHGGLLAIAVLITAIWTFSVAGPVAATLFAVYSLLAAASDNVLKPMLLGRGVDLPALVVLIGAIGGMIAYGIIGLFLGAVILGLGYTIGNAWLLGPGDSAPETADNG